MPFGDSCALSRSTMTHGGMDTGYRQVLISQGCEERNIATAECHHGFEKFPDLGTTRHPQVHVDMNFLHDTSRAKV